MRSRLAASGKPPPSPAKDLLLALHDLLHLTNLFAIALLANIPLGYLREASRRYSLHWFVYIHLSIPFILAVRVGYGFGWPAIPPTILFAVAGQLLGGRLQRRRRR